MAVAVSGVACARWIASSSCWMVHMNGTPSAPASQLSDSKVKEPDRPTMATWTGSLNRSCGADRLADLLSQGLPLLRCRRPIRWHRRTDATDELVETQLHLMVNRSAQCNCGWDLAIQSSLAS